MPAKQKNLSDLFYDGMKDIFFAEKQILRALPKMARAANSDELRQTFETHREQTQGQIERLQQVFEIAGKRATGKTCQAIQGIIEEGQEIMEEYKDTEALDAGIVASAQAIEHYEITRYGTLRTWARQLGMNDAVQLLEQTLEEEKQTDELLTQMAESSANQEAEGGGGEEEEKEEAPSKARRAKR